MTIMRRSAVHIKISVLCILNLHSILIAERSSQSQLVPSPSLCAIKPELPKAGGQSDRGDGMGSGCWTERVPRQGARAKANLRPLSKGSDVAYLIFFSVFYHFMLCHHHRQHQHQHQQRAQAQLPVPSSTSPVRGVAGKREPKKKIQIRSVLGVVNPVPGASVRAWQGQR